MLISSEDFLSDLKPIIIICCLFNFLFKEIDKNKRKLHAKSKNNYRVLFYRYV